MQTGYYWIQIDDDEPEVVFVDEDCFYRCGSDVTCLFENGEWIEYGSVLNIRYFHGPIDDEVKNAHPLQKWK